MTKSKIRILSTSNLDSTLLEKLKVMGISCDTIPFIKVSYIKNSDQEQEIGKLFDENIIAVFTSKHAIEAIKDIKGIGKACWQIYCTGSSTARLAANIFTSSNIAGSGDDATSLAKLIIKNETGSRIDFFCGDIRRDELPSIVSQLGTVREWIVYKTLLTPVKIDEEYQGILFLSPSAVRSFFSLNNPSSSTLFFAIGNTTSSAIRQFSPNRILVGKATSMESLVDRLIQEIHAVKTGDV